MLILELIAVGCLLSIGFLCIGYGLGLRAARKQNTGTEPK